MTGVRFLSVLGTRSNSPGVLAFVDGHRVSWRPSGWRCDCPDPACPHVDAVADLLDPRVTGEHTNPREDRCTPINPHQRGSTDDQAR